MSFIAQIRPVLIYRREIFESFEPPDSDQEDLDIEDRETAVNEIDSLDAAVDALARKAAEMGYDEDADEDGEEGTGVMISQLRHFVIQV